MGSLARLALALLVALAVAGCDGEGLRFPAAQTSPDGGDQGNGDEQEGEPEPVPEDTRNLGTWVTSYADDWVDSSALYGVQQYAASVNLRRTGTELSGTGTVFRVFNEGPKDHDELSIRLSGSISGDDATATVTSATGGRVEDSPVWRLRFAGNLMVGMYTSFDVSQDAVRSGHALWRRLSTGSLDDTWVSGFTDGFGTRSWPARDRTGTLVLDVAEEDSALSGQGNFIEQRDGDVALDVEFNVIRGEVSGSEVTFSLGELSLENNDMDWYGFFSNGVIVGAYAQFDADNDLVRYGHATWQDAPAAVPEDVSYRWVTAFTDSTGATGHERLDYLLSVELEAEEDNVVSGSGEFMATDGDMETFRTVVVENATVVGSRLQMDTRVIGTGEFFTWDLRLADSILVGSYQHFGALGNFLSRGSAEWRRDRTSLTDVVGTWVGAYFDTLSENTRGETTHMAMVTVREQLAEGPLSGSGVLRLGNGETGRRFFDLRDSSAEGEDILWVWRGADLFGDTVWRLRQAGNWLYGVYLNENSTGNFEARGSAVWVRTTQTDVF